MDPRVGPFRSLLDLQTRLYLNCLVDMGDAQASVQPSPGVNHAAFIALHLLDSRFVLARLLDLSTHNPFGAVLEAASTIEDVLIFPSLEELRSTWNDLAPSLDARLGGLSSAALDAPCPNGLPVLKIGEGCILDAIAFLVHHEAYHIGQLGLLRKFLGFSPMSYRAYSGVRQPLQPRGA
jgi:hypothetical protein